MMPLPNINDATRRLNPQIFGASKAVPAAIPGLFDHITTGRRLRQSAKPLMNKLETRFFAYLQREWPSAMIRPQAKRYRLGNGIWFKPDFTANVGFEIAWETKGPKAFRGGFENLKIAASTYPEIQWWLAWEEGGRWQLQRILP